MSDYSIFRRAVLGGAVACCSVAILGARVPDGQTSTPGELLPGLSAPGGARAETRHLSLTTSASTASEASARRITLFVDITPKPKMHVYSPEQKDVIPVSLTIAPADGLRPGATKFPKPEQYFFAPLEETQLVYSKPFRLAQEVTLSGATRSSVTIKGTLRYQACDEAVCYLPQNVPVSWTVALKR